MGSIRWLRPHDRQSGPAVGGAPDGHGPTGTRRPLAGPLRRPRRLHRRPAGGAHRRRPRDPPRPRHGLLPRASPTTSSAGSWRRSWRCRSSWSRCSRWSSSARRRSSSSVVVGILFTPIVARTVRSAVLAERQLDYVTAARLRGESGPFIMVREILPNIAGPIVVELTVRFGYAIFTVATLSFLGVGLQPPSPDWGLTVSQEYSNMISGVWWPTVFPALAIATTVVAVNLIADWPAIGPVRMTATIAGAPGPRRPARPPPSRSRTCRSPTWSAASRGRCCVASRSRSRPGEAYGLVGESGCGKSTTAYAAVRYLPAQRPDHRRPDPHRRRRHHQDGRRRGPPVPGEARLDGLPGSGRGPEPQHADRDPGDRGVHGPRPESGRGPEERAWRPSTASTSPTRSASSIATRISSRAGCSSAS